jgi:4-hydroxybenzoate polyprenyltransferase
MFTPAQLRQRLHAYERLIRLDKPIGILLLLWPTLWGVWLASAGRPDAMIVWIFVLGTVLMRSAGCAVNDWADRHVDGAVRRTRGRPIVAGDIAPREALYVAAVLALGALALIVPLHPLVWLLAVPAVVLAASYPFMKRWIALPQAYLGVAFGFGIPMAYAAVQHTVPPVAWALLAANVLWTLAYDTAYAMVDREDDVRIGIKTAAITFGRYDVTAVMLCHAGFLLAMAAIGASLQLGWFYYLALLVAAVLALGQYRLLRSRQPEHCFQAFLDNNWMGAAIFAGVVFHAGWPW